MSANVFVNGRFFNHRIGGVARAAREVTQRLGERVEVVAAPLAARGFAGHLWEQAALPRQIPARGLLWSPANTGPLGVRNQVVTIHDLAVFDAPEGTRPGFRLWYRMLLPRLAWRALLVLTPSEFSRGRIRARFGLPEERVRVVPNGVGPPFTPAGEPGRRIGLPGRFLLAVGTGPGRKNLGRVIAAWRAVRAAMPDLELVVVGAAVETGEGPPPRFVTGPDDAGLAAAYRHAAALVYLSGYEGFGLPLLEAMASGIPALAARGGALPEVGGDACLYADPDDEQETTAQLLALLRDAELREELRNRGLARAAEFSWEQAAERTWEALQGAANG